MTEIEFVIEETVNRLLEPLKRRISDAELKAEANLLGIELLHKVVFPKKVENVVDAEDSRDYSGSD